MYEGFYEIFVGFMAFFTSFFRKNSKNPDSGWIKKYNKSLLLVLGLILIIVGTIRIVLFLNRIH